MKTFVPNKENASKKWYVVDAGGLVLGRLAAKVAAILRGKHRPEFTPHLDMGDHVIIVNAEKIRVTGKKLKDKQYTQYSGYPSGLRTISLDKALLKKPEWVIEHAVKGMLPHNTLGRSMFRKLRVYKGPAHPHQAQQPEPLEL